MTDDNAKLTIHYRPYGYPVRGAFVDNLLLKKATSILKRQMGGVEEQTRRVFWESFLDLSNLAEICCLHDTVHFLSDNENLEETIEIFNDESLSMKGYIH